MLRVSEQRVRVLLSRGKLDGWKHGPMWVVQRVSVQARIRARAAGQTAWDAVSRKIAEIPPKG
jgi:hypothetical protein